MGDVSQFWGRWLGFARGWRDSDPDRRAALLDLVLQRAVVRRYTSGRTADPGRWRSRWRLQVGRSLPRRAFRPAPRVDSAILVVRRR